MGKSRFNTTLKMIRTLLMLLMAVSVTAACAADNKGQCCDELGRCRPADKNMLCPRRGKRLVDDGNACIDACIDLADKPIGEIIKLDQQSCSSFCKWWTQQNQKNELEENMSF